MAHGRRVIFDYAIIDVRHPARTSSHAARRIPFAVKWKIHGSIMTSEQVNVVGERPVVFRASWIINGKGNDVDRRRRMESADELNEQIALVADIEDIRRYSDAGKWATTRRTSFSPRTRDVFRRQLYLPNEIVSLSPRGSCRYSCNKITAT